MPHRASTFLNPLGACLGLQIQNRQNYAQDLQLSVRGFGARSTFGVRGIRMYVDGIPATMPDGRGQTSNIDLNSIESVDVLRGPFSALYGNASGGVININTQTGQQPATIEASSYYGSYGTSALRHEGHRCGGRRDSGGGCGLCGIHNPLHHPWLSRPQRRTEKPRQCETGRTH